MLGVLLNEAFDGDDHGGEAGLHVRRPTAVHERICVPAVEVARRNDIRVACEAQ